jgi:HNH endonuclease
VAINMAREPIPKSLRFAILRRDGHRCCYCGRHADDVVLHVDHDVPVRSGGKTEYWNLITACAACNLGKGSTVFKRSVFTEPHKAALTSYLFEYAFTRLGIPMGQEGRAWWDIHNNIQIEDAGRLVALVREAPSWAHFHIAMLGLHPPEEDDEVAPYDWALKAHNDNGELIVL